ncbi:cell division protein FtsQ/DivIB [Persicimonas caeni]|nr:FtsQ-type POTRA domain-containing protein [Persicimonas caeni]
MFGNRRKNRRRRALGQRLKSLGTKIGSLGRKALPVAFLVAVAIGLPYGIFHAYIRTVSGSYFQLQEVEVEGLHNVDEDALLESAGLLIGLNIFDVDLERADRAIEAHPWIKSAEVERRLPDQVSVRVSEEEPIALLIDERYHLVDTDAVAFKALESSDPVDELMALPLVTGMEVASLEEPEGRALFLEAMDVVQMYGELGLTNWEPLSEIHVDSVLGLTLVTADTGVEIRLGRGRYRERLERLAVVQRSIVQRAMEVDYILIDQESDLSRVAVGRRHRPRTGPGEGARVD